MSTHDYMPLNQDIIRSVLDGVESGMERIAKQDEEARSAIAGKTCSQCNGPVIAKLPSDVKKIFAGTQVQYEPWCPKCRA